jgi:DNA modification methylase
MSRDLERNTILCGDALTILKTLPSASVQTCVTSPPYYALRSYLPDSHPDKHLEIGLEETPAEYIARLVSVFREVKRVLRDNGCMWINIGDTYANDCSWGGHSSGKHCKELHTIERPRRYTGLPAKNLIGIPWRLAFALQDDGWILRQDIIWSKPSPLPESVLDRPSRSHEYVFLFAKQQNYFYDADAIRTPLKAKTLTTYGKPHHPQGNDALGLVKADNWGKSIEERKPRLNGNGEVAGANARSVWEIASEPFPGSHFAVMPTKLIQKCILAGSSPRACEHCRSPWERVTQRTGPISMAGANHPKSVQAQEHISPVGKTSMLYSGCVNGRKTTGWQPTCTCPNNLGAGRCIILDPFLGAGTVALVALEQHREFIGIELNEAYVCLAQKRIATVQPILWERGEQA